MRKYALLTLLLFLFTLSCNNFAYAEDPSFASASGNQSTLSNSTKTLLQEKQLLLYEEYTEKDGGSKESVKNIDRFAIEYAITLALADNKIALQWLNITLKNGMQLLDPVWGGMYEFSVGDWKHPNYQKTLTTQALDIRLYAEAYLLTGNVDYLRTAEKITDYMLRFLMTPEGAFYSGQLAKIKNGAPDSNYYSLNDTLRRNSGMPEMDTSVHGCGMGSAISALSTMYMVSGNKSYLDQAIKSADWTIKNLGRPDGGFNHDVSGNAKPYMCDSLNMSKAFVSLYTITADDSYLTRARHAIDFIDKNFFYKPASSYLPYMPSNASETADIRVDAANNALMTRVASLVYHYTDDPTYKRIAELALQPLTTKDAIATLSPALILMANMAASTEPLKITVIGAKEDPHAFELFLAALKFPSFYLQVRWFTTADEAIRLTQVKYPSLPRAAAFFCMNQRCSLPIYSSKEFQTIADKLIEKQYVEKRTNIISNVTTLLPTYSKVRAQQFFTDMLLHRNWIQIGFGFWLIGIFLAFTPCVFPLLMVLATLLLSSSGLISKQRRLALYLIYVVTLACTYAILGMLVSKLGVYLQAYLQSTVVLISLSLILAILAFSLLGGYKIRLPNVIQHYLISFNSFKASNTFLGAAFMAVILTLVAAPCTTAPLIAVLSIFTEVADPKVGGIALFMMGLGIGTPLLFAGFLHEKIIMTSTQEWQRQLQTLFGFLILIAAIWMVSRVIPSSIYMLLLSAFAFLAALYMGIFRSEIEGLSGKFKKALSIIIFLYGIVFFISSQMGNTNLFNLNKMDATKCQPATMGIFQKIKNMSDLKNILRIARQQNRPVLIDFYASWCESCNEMDREVFTNEEVSNLMLNFILVRVDLSSRGEGELELAKQFHVVAPPAILFFDAEGNELDARWYGDVKPDEFKKMLADILNKY